MTNAEKQEILNAINAMEAIQRITKDTKAIDEMKRWLLKQKQTQNMTSQYTASSNGSPCSKASRIVAMLSFPKEQETTCFGLMCARPPALHRTCAASLPCPSAPKPPAGA